MLGNGIRFGDKHTYTDFGLIAKTRFYISPAEPELYRQKVPGSSTYLDFSEFLTGDVQYYDREYKQDFLVSGGRLEWTHTYSRVMNFLRGKKFMMYPDEDPMHYYVGRFWVNQEASDKSSCTLSLYGKVDPYKLNVYTTAEDWPWDAFDFEDGIIQDFRNLRVSGSLNVTIQGFTMKEIPVITCSTAMQVQFNNKTYQLAAGDNTILDIMFSEGDNVLRFTGNGTITISYRGGCL